MTPSDSRSPVRPPNRLQFILLVMLFFFPLIGSAILYYWFPDARPAGTTNYGDLVAPARTAPPLHLVDAAGAARGAELLNGHWSYVTLAGADCDATCERRLILTRQLRIATNADRTRVLRVLVLDDPAQVAAVAARLAPQHPDLEVVADVGPAGQRLADFLGHRDAVAFLLDPNVNWLMSYPPGRDTQSDFKGMQKDIKKLLDLSQIG